MLHGNPMTVSQIARLVDESPSRIADDLNHFLRSLKHTEYKAIVEPAVVAPADSSSQARNSPSPPGVRSATARGSTNQRSGLRAKRGRTNLRPNDADSRATQPHRWDPEFAKGNFELGYYDRMENRIILVPLKEVAFPKERPEIFEIIDMEGQVQRTPFHRVREVYRDSQRIWHRGEASAYS